MVFNSIITLLREEWRTDGTHNFIIYGPTDAKKVERRKAIKEWTAANRTSNL
jgi:hypothetical protein